MKNQGVIFKFLQDASKKVKIKISDRLLSSIEDYSNIEDQEVKETPLEVGSEATDDEQEEAWWDLLYKVNNRLFFELVDNIHSDIELIQLGHLVEQAFKDRNHPLEVPIPDCFSIIHNY